MLFGYGLFLLMFQSKEFHISNVVEARFPETVHRYAKLHFVTYQDLVILLGIHGRLEPVVSLTLAFPATLSLRPNRHIRILASRKSCDHSH
jgi:hypothetical protein